MESRASDRQGLSARIRKAARGCAANCPDPGDRQIELHGERVQRATQKGGLVTPLLNKRALQKLGWTPTLIQSVLGQPDKTQHHRKGLCHWVEHLYARDRVDQGMRDTRFLELLEKRKRRAAAADRRLDEFTSKYPSWRAALPAAAAGLFSLNRYVKHRQCSELQKFEIYELKNEFIEMLYGQGFCTRAWLHLLHQEEQLCRECGGSGDECGHCGGSGVWRSARTLEFWCFQFSVEGRAYCWHQPKSSVAFQPEESVPPQEWEGLPGEKPIALPLRKFAGAKALLRWVLDAAAAAQQEIKAPSFHSFSSGFISSPPSSCHQDTLFPLFPPG